MINTCYFQGSTLQHPWVKPEESLVSTKHWARSADCTDPSKKKPTNSAEVISLTPAGHHGGADRPLIHTAEATPPRMWWFTFFFFNGCWTWSSATWFISTLSSREMRRRRLQLCVSFLSHCYSGISWLWHPLEFIVSTGLCASHCVDPCGRVWWMEEHCVVALGLWLLLHPLWFPCEVQKGERRGLFRLFFFFLITETKVLKKKCVCLFWQ